MRLVGLNVIVGLMGTFSYGLAFLGPVSSTSPDGALLGLAALALGLALHGRFLPAFVEATMPGGDRPQQWSRRATPGASSGAPWAATWCGRSP